MLFGTDSITEDRMVALRKRAELDAKYVVTFIPDDASELSQSLNRHVACSLFICLCMSLLFYGCLLQIVFLTG